MKKLILLLPLVLFFSCTKPALEDVQYNKSEVLADIKGNWLLSRGVAYSTKTSVNNGTATTVRDSLILRSGVKYAVYDNTNLPIDSVQINVTNWNINGSSLILNNKNSYSYTRFGENQPEKGIIINSPVKRIFLIDKISSNQIKVNFTSQYTGQLLDKSSVTLYFNRK